MCGFHLQNKFIELLRAHSTAHSTRKGKYINVKNCRLNSYTLAWPFLQHFRISSVPGAKKFLFDLKTMSAKLEVDRIIFDGAPNRLKFEPRAQRNFTKSEDRKTHLHMYDHNETFRILFFHKEMEFLKFLGRSEQKQWYLPYKYFHFHHKIVEKCYFCMRAIHKLLPIDTKFWGISYYTKALEAKIGAMLVVMMLISSKRKQFTIRPDRISNTGMLLCTQRLVTSGFSLKLSEIIHRTLFLQSNRRKRKVRMWKSLELNTWIMMILLPSMLCSWIKMILFHYRKFTSCWCQKWATASIQLSSFMVVTCLRKNFPIDRGITDMGFNCLI